MLGRISGESSSPFRRTERQREKGSFLQTIVLSAELFYYSWIVSEAKCAEEILSKHVHSVSSYQWLAPLHVLVHMWTWQSYCWQSLFLLNLVSHSRIFVRINAAYISRFSIGFGGAKLRKARTLCFPKVHDSIILAPVGECKRYVTEKRRCLYSFYILLLRYYTCIVPHEFRNVRTTPH